MAKTRRKTQNRRLLERDQVLVVGSEKTTSEFTPFSVSGGRSLLERAKEASNGRGKTYKGVTIIRAGIGNKKDRNYYPPDVLKESAESGVFEGLRAYIDHPDSVSEEILPERSIRDVGGLYRNTKFKESKNGGRVVGDLHILGNHKWLADMIDELIEIGASDKIGISINGRGQTKPARVKLAESGEEIDVNWLERFLDLRSADLVTEAGAGGGFQQLLESARGTKESNSMGKLTKKELAELQEAAGKGDKEALAKLAEAAAASLEEASDKSKKKDKSKTKARREENDEDDDEQDDLEESDGDDAEDDEDEDYDAELDRAVAEAKGDLDDEDDDEEADDEDDLEESDDDDLEDDEDSADLEEADDEEGNRKARLMRAVERQRTKAKGASAGKGEDREERSAREARSGGSFNKPAKSQRRQKGRGYPSSTGKSGIRTSREAADDPRILRMERKLQKLAEKNSRLSAQLRIRSTADRARNVLKESRIPEDIRPDVLPLLVGKSEPEMRKIIQYHEKLYASILREAGGRPDFDEVEGAGSRLREGGYYGDADDRDDLEDVFEELGIPMKMDADDDE